MKYIWNYNIATFLIDDMQVTVLHFIFKIRREQMHPQCGAVLN